jgi:starch synthase
MVAAKKITRVQTPAALRVLHVASEIYPLVKTGGLADVVAALPEAQEAAGAEVRVLVPGIPAVLRAMERKGAGARLVADIGPIFGAAKVRLLTWRLDVPAITLYAIDAPLLYRRQGGPYHAPDGQEWPDNLQRFALLGWVACQLAQGDLDPDWVPQIVHAHDWHAGMACLYLKAHPHENVRSVFTIHNLAYQGLFPMADQSLLGLSSKFLSSSGLEYHGHLSMMKAGLKFADRITTVSPTYAREIATDAYGAGLDGVIRSRGQDVSGILNGIDQRVWNPSTDTALAQTFDGDDVRGKAVCKQALQAEFQLEQSARAMVLIAISRLTSQKGLDLLLQAWPKIQSWGLQLVVQGTGDKDLEAGFRDLADRYPGQVAVHIGYDEERAHRLMAGGDALVVPSRFEPCGLTQLYAMRYGTLPIVRATGGLADTVVDLVADPEHATGFQFRDATVDDLVHAIHRAHEAWHQRTVRQRLIANAMRQDFSWDQPARDYLQLYETVLSR